MISLQETTILKKHFLPPFPI